MTPTDEGARSQSGSLSFEFDLHHPPETVWRALTDPVLLKEWLLPVVELELRLEPGAAFTYRTQPQPGWDGIVNCEVLELVPERKLVLSWVSNMIDTKLTILLEPEGSGTHLTLLHTGFTGVKGVMTSFILGSGWKGMVQHGIPNLMATLDTEGRL